MSIDAGPVGRITAELMEQIEEEYPDAHFEDAIVIVEVSYPSEDDDETFTAGRYRSTSHRASTVMGMLELTCDRVREPFEQGDE